MWAGTLESSSMKEPTQASDSSGGLFYLPVNVLNLKEK